jgi:hypothetical protein
VKSVADEPSDELRSLAITERGEDRDFCEDARDRLGVHGAERYARACVCHRNKSEIASPAVAHRY